MPRAGPWAPLGHLCPWAAAAGPRLALPGQGGCLPHSRVVPPTPQPAFLRPCPLTPAQTRPGPGVRGEPPGVARGLLRSPPPSFSRIAAGRRLLVKPVLRRGWACVSRTAFRACDLRGPRAGRAKGCVGQRGARTCGLPPGLRPAGEQPQAEGSRHRFTSETELPSAPPCPAWPRGGTGLDVARAWAENESLPPLDGRF